MQYPCTTHNASLTPIHPSRSPNATPPRPPFLHTRRTHTAVHKNTQLHLSKSGLTFPIQLIPNNHGLFQSIGLDTAAGFVVLGVAAWSRLRSGMPLFPPLGGGARGTRSGGRKGKRKAGGEQGGKEGGRGVWESVKVPWKLEGARVKKKVRKGNTTFSGEDKQCPAMCVAPASNAGVGGAQLGVDLIGLRDGLEIERERERENSCRVLQT